jgi:hypothetical protein
MDSLSRPQYALVGRSHEMQDDDQREPESGYAHPPLRDFYGKLFQSQVMSLEGTEFLIAPLRAIVRSRVPLLPLLPTSMESHNPAHPLSQRTAPKDTDRIHLDARTPSNRTVLNSGTLSDRETGNDGVRRRKLHNEPTQSETLFPNENDDETWDDNHADNDAHSKRKKKIQHILDPIAGGEYNECTLVLLCWGRPEHCEIFPINLPLSAGEVAKWEIIRKAWYEHRGAWRRCIPFYCVQEVRRVEVSFVSNSSIGLNSTDGKTPRLPLQDDIQRGPPLPWTC